MWHLAKRTTKIPDDWQVCQKIFWKALGIDMFDCVLPSRNARTASFTPKRINIKNAKWQDDFSPAKSEATSRIHTKAYLRHLFKVEELLAAQIATLQFVFSSCGC
ncbi:MAG: tRNA-guanine transglycosylase [Saprospiraceae bacterium]